MEPSYHLNHLADEAESWWPVGRSSIPCVTARAKPQVEESHTSQKSYPGLLWIPSLDQFIRWAGKISRVLSRRQVEYLFTKSDALPPQSLLLSLPNELLLRIMEFLPPESLWSLRQSSLVFFELFEKIVFKRVHSIPGLRDRHVRFNLNRMTMPGRAEAVEQLRRDKTVLSTSKTYCGACADVLSRGEDDPMMVQLRRTRFCDGCSKRHLSIFFSPESIRQYESGAIERLLCVGRVGTMTLCSHERAPTLTWKKMEEVITKRNDFEAICKDVCHKPYGAACPRIWAHRRLIDTVQLELGWKRPLLDIDPGYPPSLQDLRRVVAITLESTFKSGSDTHQKPCRHVLDGQQLRAFANAAICKCFCNPSSGQAALCDCARKKRLECKDCAAVYSFHLQSGRISLAYHFRWDVVQPTSPAWISLLEGGPQGLGMFDEENRHLLWCDSSGCATGMGPRWEELLKEAIWLQHLLYDKEDRGRGDWSVLKYKRPQYRLNEEDLLGGFELPPHLQDPWREQTANFLRRIEEAADTAQGTRRGRYGDDGRKDLV